MQQLHSQQPLQQQSLLNNATNNDGITLSTIQPVSGVSASSSNTTTATGLGATTTTMGYTSTTAPGIVFTTRSELAEHYKSDWHRYNLKRREAGLPMLFLQDFQTRLQAAAAVKAAQESSVHHGTDHLKQNSSKNNKKMNSNNNKQFKKNNQQQQQQKQPNQQHVVISQVSAYEQIKKENEARKQQQQEQQSEPDIDVTDDKGNNIPESIVDSKETKNSQTNEADKVDTRNEVKAVSFATTDDIDLLIESTDDNDNNNVEGNDDDEETMIDPRQSLFDRTISRSVDDNVSRMYKKYGFFVPDQEYIIDLEGLIGYCHEKIMLGHTCLYCQRIFPTVQSCKQHMIDTNHTKLRYEPDIDLDELAVFYDFTAADNEFLQHTTYQQAKKSSTSKTNRDNDDDEEWEDASDGDDKEMDEENEGDDDEDDDAMYDEYQREIATLGWDITPLGELVFPDGRIIGHRALRRYYQQRPQPQRSNSEAVNAALLGAQERLYRGTVYTLTNGETSTTTTSTRGNTLAMLRLNGNSNAISSASANLLKQNGIRPGTVSGRVGKGILVPTTAGATGAVSYSQLSVYRYRAAIKKQRRMEFKGKQIQQKQQLNMNHMDKKHNRIMNGVSVQHAKR